MLPEVLCHCVESILLTQGGLGSSLLTSLWFIDMLEDLEGAGRGEIGSEGGSECSKKDKETRVWEGK